VTDSIHQQIIDKIDARFKTIKKTGGYKTDVGLHVFDWLDRDLADTELDALIYRDKSNTKNASSQKIFDNKVQLEIEFKTKSAGSTARQVRMMAEDVYKAIGIDETWGGLAQKTNPLQDNINVDQANKIVGSGTITVEIEYRTAKWQY